MKVLKVENPLTEEQIKQIEKYFKEEISCKCGVTFETDIRDYTIDVISTNNSMLTCKTRTYCPSCRKAYVKTLRLLEEKVKEFEIYQTYLNAKEQFKCKEQ